MAVESLANAMTILAQRLLAQAATDAELRATLRTLAECVLSATESVPAPETRLSEEKPRETVVPSVIGPNPVTGPVQGPAMNGTGLHQAEAPLRKSPLPELTLGTPRPSVPSIRYDPKSVSRGETTDDELVAIEARCRLKAEALKWSVKRRQWIAEGADLQTEIGPKDREFRGRARELGKCVLWMSHQDFKPQGPPSLLNDAAGCFEAVADGIVLSRSILGGPKKGEVFLERALTALAEAQSALRVAIKRIGRHTDDDQNATFKWLQEKARESRIRIKRYMKAGDQADPDRLQAIRILIEALKAKVGEAPQRNKRQKELLAKFRYHAHRIEEGADVEQNWQTVARTVDEMLASGVYASDPRIREALLPILEGLPDELGPRPAGFDRALQAIDSFPEDAPEEDDSREPTEAVREVARLLKGRSILLIGNRTRPDTEEALREAFELEELVLHEARDHQSVGRFEPDVAREEVVLVLLLIKWGAHSFGEVKRYCDQYGKPLVRIRAGFGVNQIAVQILNQASKRLQATEAAKLGIT